MAASIDPWRYSSIASDPSTTALYKKGYANIKVRDFYNIDPTCQPLSTEPAKLYLHRYFRYEPYFYEMFDLDREIHPYHPLHPSIDDIQKITSKAFFLTRNHVPVPLKKKKSENKKPSRRPALDLSPSEEFLETGGAIFGAGISESATHMSPDDLQSEWQASDVATGSNCTPESPSIIKEKDMARAIEIPDRDPLEKIRTVRQLWQVVVNRPRNTRSRSNPIDVRLEREVLGRPEAGGDHQDEEEDDTVSPATSDVEGTHGQGSAVDLPPEPRGMASYCIPYESFTSESKLSMRLFKSSASNLSLAKKKNK